MSRKGVDLERLRQNLSVVLQVARSRWVLTGVRQANDNPRAAVNRSGRRGAEPEGAELGPAPVLWGTFVVDI